MSIQKTDFLVIGSGVAGLSYAIKVAEKWTDKKVIIATKKESRESNTKYAQGGIAVALHEDDSFEQHIADTLKAGDGLCNKEVVEMVVSEGPQRFKELVNWGANFDQEHSGDYDLGMEGGHSGHRILHHKDITGREIARAMLARINELPNAEILEHHLSIDLITEHHLNRSENSTNITCFGAYFLNEKSGEVETIVSKATLLATGGIGQVYGHTTNPAVATGDGIAMAYRAKTHISNMEFVQFHPTALFEPGQTPAFLISEAVRGFGAYLCHENGERFMQLYDERMELASRDIVSKAIDSEMKNRPTNNVYLDCRHLNKEGFLSRFPTIYNKCATAGVNIFNDLIPVVPAAHYLCGGIDTDLNAATQIRNLFACGECTYTGLHGANRLASNSLLEALVFSHRAFISAGKIINKISIPENIPEWVSCDENITDSKTINNYKSELQDIMRNYAGIVMSNKRLSTAEEMLNNLYESTELLYRNHALTTEVCELRNMVTVGYLIVQQSKLRKENKGVFYNEDL